MSNTFDYDVSLAEKSGMINFLFTKRVKYKLRVDNSKSMIRFINLEDTVIDEKKYNKKSIDKFIDFKDITSCLTFATLGSSFIILFLFILSAITLLSSLMYGISILFPTAVVSLFTFMYYSYTFVTVKTDVGNICFKFDNYKDANSFSNHLKKVVNDNKGGGNIVTRPYRKLVKRFKNGN